MPPSIKLALGAVALAGLCAAGACGSPATNAAAGATNATAPAMNAPAINTTLAAPPSDAADAADAQAFLAGLYAHYQTSKNNTFSMFGANAGEVFDPDMIALLKADTKALKGDLGMIDGDWLCDCQDFTSLQATIKVTAATPTTAEAASDYHDTGDPSRPPDHDDFDLVKVNGHWRIHDITVRGQPPLRKSLQDEIASLAAGGQSNRAIDDAP